MAVWTNRSAHHSSAGRKRDKGADNCWVLAGDQHATSSELAGSSLGSSCRSQGRRDRREGGRHPRSSQLSTDNSHPPSSQPLAMSSLLTRGKGTSRLPRLALGLSSSLFLAKIPIRFRVRTQLVATPILTGTCTARSSRARSYYPPSATLSRFGQQIILPRRRSFKSSVR